MRLSRIHVSHGFVPAGDPCPGMVVIGELMAPSSEPSDLANVFKAQVLFWMLRAIDGTVKNFSLFLTPGGRFQLTPLYDVLSAWRVFGGTSGKCPQQKLKMAMAWLGVLYPNPRKPVRADLEHRIGRRGGVRDTSEPRSASLAVARKASLLGW